MNIKINENLVVSTKLKSDLAGYDDCVIVSVKAESHTGEEIVDSFFLKKDEAKKLVDHLCNELRV